MTTDNNYDIGIFDPMGININPLNDKPYSDTYKNLSQFWCNLPGYSMGKEIVTTIQNNSCTLIQSFTGSGKTVLVPKFALHVNNYKGQIIVTLPKKIITKKAAEFAAQTLDVELGEQVGYQFRGDNLKSKNTILLYSTDGSIISMLKSDQTLRKVDIIIIDEAHERKVQIDLLLYLIKNAIKLRIQKGIAPLKLIIMSATINEQLFRNYYKDISYNYLFLSGKPNYPIKPIYLETPLDPKTKEYIIAGKKIINNIIQNINNKKYAEGDILFFVCTISECEQTTTELLQTIKDSFIMALYSGFNQELEQYISNKDKYKDLNPKFKRRIFISTNVAESSLTIDGIVYVIDSGLEMGVKYDPKRQFNVMTKHMITKSQIAQRRGRAGRTRPGTCYHLYTPLQEENTPEFPDPEILREDLKNLCLTLMKLGQDINNANFTISDTIQMFSEFIEPPLQSFITDGFQFAINNNLITNDILSELGQLTVKTRLDVQDALSLLYAFNINTETFMKVFNIICILSFIKHGINDFFYKDAPDKQKNNIIKILKSNCNHSEHILLYKIYKYIESDKLGIFNIKLFNDIFKIYNNQLEKMFKEYDAYNIKIDVIKKDSDVDVINSFNYGYKMNKVSRQGDKFKYNDIPCDLSKSVFTYDKYKSIVFYSNLFINNKLNIVVCSPWLLD
ncbi:MAG: HrpA-like RNA helicase [Gaeavirus sp.]|uniref:HrpA-like RNA helicase n=1 Tax=Gaeavirus sp. TaxID=2487767 RepID=A0A3G5A2U1_9VIRU|nr:MAG: HrpA-like RNA helicase [Gaeavirus sp.]AYV80158.1 MAG: HrpA-like RNA helicase [Gaeavirus sp.]